MERVNSNNIHDYMDNINGGNPWNVSAVTDAQVTHEQITTKSTYVINNGKAELQTETSVGYQTCKMPIQYYNKIRTEHTPRASGGLSVILVDDEMNVLKAVYSEPVSAGTKVNFEFDVPLEAKWILFNTSNTPNYTRIEADCSNPFWGKNVAILGDSISTNGNDGEDKNAVEITIEDEDVDVELSAYLTYYDVQAELSLGGHTFTSGEIGTEVTFTPTQDDVGKVIGRPKTFNANSDIIWWEFAKNNLGFNAIPVCWSGASICSHEQDNEQLKASNFFHDAMIRKCGIRTPGSMTRTAPDYIIIFGGCNDMTHPPYARLTTDFFDSGTFEVPQTDVVAEGNPNTYGFKEAYSILISKLRATYPSSKIYLCTLSVFKRVNKDHFPVNNGINTWSQFNNAIREIADYFGCGVIEFDKCGITFENCYVYGYITYSSTTPTHPSNKGHAVMGGQAIKNLLNN